LYGREVTGGLLQQVVFYLHEFNTSTVASSSSVGNVEVPPERAVFESVTILLTVERREKDGVANFEASLKNILGRLFPKMKLSVEDTLREDDEGTHAIREYKISSVCGVHDS